MSKAFIVHCRGCAWRNSEEWRSFCHQETSSLAVTQLHDDTCPWYFILHSMLFVFMLFCCKKKGATWADGKSRLVFIRGFCFGPVILMGDIDT